MKTTIALTKHHLPNNPDNYTCWYHETALIM